MRCFRLDRGHGPGTRGRWSRRDHKRVPLMAISRAGHSLEQPARHGRGT